MANKTVILTSRQVPPRCRSKALREAGIKPSETGGIVKRIIMPSEFEIPELPTATVYPYPRGSSEVYPVLIDCGIWNDAAIADAPIYASSLNPKTMLYEQHFFWLYGVRWRALLDYANKAPMLKSAYWQIDFLWEDLEIVSRKTFGKDCCYLTWKLRNRYTGTYIEPTASPVLRYNVFILSRDGGMGAPDRTWEKNYKGLSDIPTIKIDAELMERSEYMGFALQVELNFQNTHHIHALRDSEGNYILDKYGIRMLTHDMGTLHGITSAETRIEFEDINH